jgi:hypothetical protein
MTAFVGITEQAEGSNDPRNGSTVVHEKYSGSNRTESQKRHK